MNFLIPFLALFRMLDTRLHKQRAGGGGKRGMKTKAFQAFGQGQFGKDCP